MKNKKHLKKVAGGGFNFGGEFAAAGNVVAKDNSKTVNTLNTVNKSEDSNTYLQITGNMTLF